MFRRLLYIILVCVWSVSGWALGYKLTSWATVGLKGSFRIRANSFYNPDLGRGGHSGWAALEPKKTATWADMRLRVEPWLDAAGYAKIRMRLDIMDDFVFGSTPVNPMVPDTQAPEKLGLNSFRHAIRVKMVWIEVPLFQRVMLSGGRMPNQFGLGILRNDGSGLDSDYGDAADGVRVRVRVSHNVYFQFAWEMPYEGAVSESPVRYMGPIFDLDQEDDANRWVLTFDSMPTFPEDWDEMAKQKQRFDFGFYNAFTKQKLSSERINRQVPQGCSPYAGARPFGVPYNCYTLTPRDAFFYSGSLWLRYWKRQGGWYFRFESEFAGVFGKLGHAQSFYPQDSTSKTFLTFGAAVELEVRKKRHQGLLYLGFASGDNVPYFGVTDGFTYVGPDDQRYHTSKPKPYYADNDTVTGFLFNRDYLVDSLLFREVIGTITNAIYFKPAYYFNALDKHGHRLKVGAWVLSAMAFNKNGTPGKAWFLGVEPGIGLKYIMGKHLDVDLNGSVLFPGGALDEGQGSAAVGSGLRLRITTKF